MDGEKQKLVSYSRNVMSGAAVFAGTRVQVDSLFDSLIGGHTLAEFLDDFPTVSREQAVELLNEAAARFDDEATIDECKRRSAEMDANPEMSITMEELDKSIREKFPFIKTRK